MINVICPRCNHEYDITIGEKGSPLNNAIRADERRVMAKELQSLGICTLCSSMNKMFGTKCASCPIRKAVEG